MAETTSYPTVTPYLVVPDGEALLKFVARTFGAIEQQCQRHEDGTVAHAELKIGDSLIMVGQAGGPWKALGAALYLWVDDVDSTYAKALRAGATSVPPNAAFKKASSASASRTTR